MTVGEVQTKLNIPNSLPIIWRSCNWDWSLPGGINSGSGIQPMHKPWRIALSYNGCSTRERVITHNQATATREGFVFENFFRSIFERIFGSSTFQKILEQIPLQRFTKKPSKQSS